MRKFFFINLCFLFSFCSLFGQKDINLFEAHFNSELIKLSTFTKDIQYIPLETTPEILLSEELQIIYTGDFIFVGDQQTMSFYRFNKDGSFINKIGARGNGPGEYSAAMFFHVDTSKKEVYIVGTQTSEVFLYTYDGEFKRKIFLEELGWNISLLNNDIIYFNNRYYRKGDTTVYELYLADQNGTNKKKLESTVLDLNIKGIVLHLPFFYHFNDKLHYKNPLSGNIYSIDNNLILQPIYHIQTDNSPIDSQDLNKAGDPMTVRHIFENENILLITYIYQNQIYYSIAQKSDMKFSSAIHKSNPGFIDDIQDGIIFKPHSHFSNLSHILVSYVSADDFLNQVNTNTSFTTKNSWVKKLKNDDNPIIVIVDL